MKKYIYIYIYKKVTPCLNLGLKREECEKLVVW